MIKALLAFVVKSVLAQPVDCSQTATISPPSSLVPDANGDIVFTYHIDGAPAKWFPEVFISTNPIDCYVKTY
jgi:hypothetical protein